MLPALSTAWRGMQIYLFIIIIYCINCVDISCSDTAYSDIVQFFKLCLWHVHEGFVQLFTFYAIRTVCYPSFFCIVLFICVHVFFCDVINDKKIVILTRSLGGIVLCRGCVQLLRHDPAQRMPLLYVMNHPWIKSCVLAPPIPNTLAAQGLTNLPASSAAS